MLSRHLLGTTTTTTTTTKAWTNKVNHRSIIVFRQFFWSSSTTTTTKEEEEEDAPSETKSPTAPKNKSVGAASAPAAEADERPAPTTTMMWRPEPMKPYEKSPQRAVSSIPPHIRCPPYAANGHVPYYDPNELVVLLHNTASTELQRMKAAAQLARRGLELACSLVTTEVAVVARNAAAGSSSLFTTEDLDQAVHDFLVKEGGSYPSPLNYHGFPKSICSSINEVICHGIPDKRPLQVGDVASFDISCYLDGVHGDNCGTVLVGDTPSFNTRIKQEDDDGTTQPMVTNATYDWRGTPQRTIFDSPEQKEYFLLARRLIETTREALYAGISVCKPGVPTTLIGSAIQDVVDTQGFQTNRKYYGHGISSNFHHAPFIQHYRSSSNNNNNNNTKPDSFSTSDVMQPGMIFTIEPMIMEGPSDESYEWTSDHWTVVSQDGGLAAQFEHTVLITDHGVEILTLLPEEEEDTTTTTNKMRDKE